MNHDIVERTYGIVAENKVLGQNDILVWPAQKTPWMQGAVQSQLQSVTGKTVDANGKAVEATSRTDTAHEATWQPVDSNWATAPDVQRGEVVELLRYADTDQYFWRERGNGANRRRLETKRMLISASKTAGDPNPNTHYMIEISGHTGAINMSTAMANGEKASYQFTLNGAGGMASLSDNLGQEVVLDTVNKTVRLRNAEQTTFELNEQDVGIFALGNVGFFSKETIRLECKTLEMIAGEKIEMESPDIYLNGLIHLNGPIVQEKSTTGFKASFKGPMIVEEDVTAGGVSVINHIHGGVETGSGRSGAPIK